MCCLLSSICLSGYIFYVYYLLFYIFFSLWGIFFFVVMSSQSSAHPMVSMAKGPLFICFTSLPGSLFLVIA